MNAKILFGTALVATAMLTTACSKLGALSADNFTVTPSPLEAHNGKVSATINGRFPEKYMKKKATVTVTPVLRYQGGEAQGQSASFQGENVLGNDQTVSYKLGGNYTMRANYDYVPAMEQSELWLTFQGKIGKKVANIPDVRVANGVLATSELLQRTALTSNTATGKDAYQYAIQQTKDAEIKYLIAQSQVRTSELKSVSVQDFVKTLRDIKADQKGFLLDNIEISAYASPDGKFDFNKKLAERRQQTSTEYVNGQLKSIDLTTNVDGKYTAEDWDGFQELVSQSNIQDKEVILRVLSMYEDPEEREKQVHNISTAYTDLAKEILPELRRARMRVNYELIGRTDSEIEEQYKSDPTQLSVEELLYAATLTDDASQKEAILKTTTQQYASDYRAYNNLAELAFQKGDMTSAKQYLEKAAALNGNADEVNANKALIALTEGNTEEAETLLGKAANASNYSEVLGNLCIARGQYGQAQQCFGSTATNSSALAAILNKDYSTASKALDGVKNADATTDYLKAIVAARQSKDSDAISSLKQAISKDASLKDYASKDLEFQTLFNDSAFQSLVK